MTSKYTGESFGPSHPKSLYYSYMNRVKNLILDQASPHKTETREPHEITPEEQAMLDMMWWCTRPNQEQP